MDWWRWSGIYGPRLAGEAWVGCLGLRVRLGLGAGERRNKARIVAEAIFSTAHWFKIGRTSVGAPLAEPVFAVARRTP